MSSTSKTCPLTQFTTDTGKTLCMSAGDIIAWEGINKKQIYELINFQTDDQQVSGEFHSWCVHKKSKKLLDDYTDPTTKTGSIVKEIMVLHNCDELEYVEFEKTPKFLETLLARENVRYKNYEWYGKYKNAQDWTSGGFCFQRAHNKHKSNKNWKVKFGEVWMKNSKTGLRLNIEGANDQIINRHIGLLQNKVGRGLMSKVTAKRLAGFFMSHSQHLLNAVIDSWPTDYHNKRQRDKIRKVKGKARGKKVREGGKLYK